MYGMAPNVLIKSMYLQRYNIPKADKPWAVTHISLYRTGCYSESPNNTIEIKKIMNQNSYTNLKTKSHY